MATVTRTGVKWVKVSKTDALGNNYDNSWRLNDSFRLNYTTPGNTEYIVNSVTEYPTYWLLGLNYVNTTSSIQGAKNYRLLASSSGQPLDGNTTVTVQYKPVINTLGYFNDNTDKYTLQVTPNIPLQISGSIEIQALTNTATEIYLSIVENGETSIKTNIFAIPPGSSGLKFQCSASMIVTASSNYSYEIKAYNNTVGADMLILGGSAVNTKFIVTQSVAPASNTLTVLDPFITQPFEGTDCDVTYGWIQSYPNSQYYMDADYTNNATVPANQQALISGTAAPAPVKDYYYSSNRQIIPRYIGKESTAQKYNVYSTGSITLDEKTTLVGDYGTYGKLSTIDVNRVYFAYFEYIYGLTPEYTNKTSLKVKYLIDQLGNVYQPGLSKDFLGNLRHTLTDGETVILNLNGSTDGTTIMQNALNGPKTILRSGYKVEPVAYTQTGSSYTSSITLLGESTSPTPNYLFRANRTVSTTYTVGTTNRPTFPTEIYDNYTAYNSYRYIFPSASQTNISFVNYFTVANTADEQSAVGTVTIYKNYLSSKTPIAQTTFTIPPGTGETLSTTIRSPYLSFDKNDEISIEVSNQGVAGFTYVGSFYNRQYTLGSNITASAPFFTAPSVSGSILTASQELSNYAGLVKQQDIANSGFNPINYTFDFQVGDQLRFNNDEAKAYTIQSITSADQTNDGKIYLTLNQNLTSGSNLDYFLLRRFADDPTSVIIDSGKPGGGTPGGTAKPQFVSTTLDNNFSTILNDLSSKNLI